MSGEREEQSLVAENEALRSRVAELERRLARFGSGTGVGAGTDELGRATSEREALLSEAERIAHIGSWVWDVRENRVVWSDELFRILGYDPGKDEASTEAFFARVHPLDVARVRAASEYNVRTGLSGTIEYRLLLQDGVIREVTTDGALLFDAEGVLQRAVGAVMDVTRSRVAEVENRKVRQLLEETQRLTQSGSWEWDMLTGEARWTPELYRLLGVPDGTVPSLELFQSRLHPEDREDFLAAVQRTRSAGEVKPMYECRILRGSEVRRVRFISGPVEDATGVVVGARGTLSDITTQTKLEEQLLQSRKMDAIGQLSFGIAHDFNNLLLVLLDAADRLRAGDDVASCVSDIETASRSAAALTHRLLAFSRKAVLTPTLVDLVQVIQEIGPLVSRTIGENIGTRFEYPAEALVTRVDPHQVHQVILNLAVNARDAIPGAGQLSVRLQGTVLASGEVEGLAAGPYALVVVQDTGSGMDQEVLAHLFEPFFTTKEVGKGTGLGLAVVYGAMKQCGGGVTVESAVGKGTTFRLYFPREASEADPARPASVPPPRRTRVLLVEDDAHVRRAVEGMLQRAGCDVVVAGGAEEALALFSLRRGSVDVLATDVVMPGMQGGELAERLLVADPELGVLFVTGHGQRAAVTETLRGRALVLQKPFRHDDLARALDELQQMKHRR